MFVISQSYYHLWQAFVDEKPVALLRANFAFQAIEVPAGTHRVKLVYRDYNLPIVFCVSLASLIACVFVCRKQKQSIAPATSGTALNLAE
jgi:uncharacterized membrane protein YfhO